MKKNLILFILFSTISSFSDTTFTVDLNFDGKSEKVSFSVTETNNYILEINGDRVYGELICSYDPAIEIFDINRNDNRRDLAVSVWCEGDNKVYNFYQYSEGKIDSIGTLSAGYLEINGNSVIRGSKWMGFYAIMLDYEFDFRKKKIQLKTKEFYDVNQKAKVTSEFSLRTYRDDNSSVAHTLKPGDEITLVKSDVSPQCPDENISGEYAYIYDIFCDWFLIKTKDGRKGWCRLRDFKDKVEGLIWAG
ncbi:MAG: hypothetical protein N2510_01235 [Ignavibacteria bacterium]|nr:hypothetical protein [Ignavibacteria bacterium]